ncbi:mitochondrial import protein 1 [Trichomonascus vanleenenianus]|uniref:Mim1p n=1 Tax=Trichomonascus vanleenenianus TaxID=2268995 RepID=UPI003EC97621
MAENVIDLTQEEYLSSGSSYDYESHSANGSSSDEVAVRGLAVTPASLVVRAVINLFLPFVNGMMLGFGEIFAHELGFKWGWVGARVHPLRATRRVREEK